LEGDDKRTTRLIGRGPFWKILASRHDDNNDDEEDDGLLWWNIKMIFVVTNIVIIMGWSFRSSKRFDARNASIDGDNSNHRGCISILVGQRR
jgi:hypothetical protein